jgi:hypothetical protein
MCDGQECEPKKKSPKMTKNPISAGFYTAQVENFSSVDFAKGRLVFQAVSNGLNKTFST